MSSVSTSLALQDRMTSTLNKATQGTNRLLKALEAVDAKSLDLNTAKALKAATKAAQATEKELQSIAKQLDAIDAKSDPLSGIMGKMGGVFLGFGLANAAKNAMDLSDNMTNTTARLNMMNDELQTTAELQNKIMESANRSRTNYLKTADAVAKMGIMAGEAFNSNDEVIAFTELINKQFKIAGTSAEGQSAAMLQLIQAMGSGVLRGEELNSIFEQAPNIIQTVADYLDVPLGQIRAMASEGQITAEIVKNAMLSSAAEINTAYAEMPMTFSQVGEIISNMMLETFQPAIQYIGQGAQWIYDNWAPVSSVILGVGAALLFAATAQGIKTAVDWLAIATNKEMIRTLLASPYTWIALAIGVVVAAIYNWIQSVGGLHNAWTICTNSVQNGADRMYLAGCTLSVGFQNAIGDMASGTLKFIEDMVNGAIKLINGLINTVNKIPGVAIQTIDNVTFGTEGMINNQAEKQARNADLTAKQTEIQNRISARQAETAAIKAEAAAKNAEKAAGNGLFDASGAYIGSGAGDYTIPNIGTVAEVGKISTDVNIADEDLKLMKDVAEMRYVQSFVTLQPTVSMSASITKDADFDAFYEQFGQRITEELEASAEDVY